MNDLSMTTSEIECNVVANENPSTIIPVDGISPSFSATSPTKDGSSSKSRANRIARKQIKKKIDLGSDDKLESPNDFYNWSNSTQPAQTFEFQPNEEIKTPTFIDPTTISITAFQFGSPENEKKNYLLN